MHLCANFLSIIMWYAMDLAMNIWSFWIESQDKSHMIVLFVMFFEIYVASLVFFSKKCIT
jgi:hypothetical protein